ncbi:adenylate cyclase type 10-like [Limosa lapponica baueri]|uniref:Adenylate cyclase type 10-like n=1 Tax=Limosa lapponica baueri TaxID=1758121 RepID=A0A2I0TH32_LIMLA|nr:adenylate cyclase type 10-like [Limosa lapponica baueri]
MELPSESDGKCNGDCSCQAIVESVLAPLAQHCLAVGDAGRAFYYLLESAAGYLYISNSSMALMKLNEAKVLRKTKATAIACFEEATFFSLKGEVKRGGGLLPYELHKAGKENDQGGFEPARKALPPELLWSLHQVSGGEVATCRYVRRAASLPQEIRRKRLASLLRQSCRLSLLEQFFHLEGTSRGQRFSDLAVRMKANMDREADSYQAADSCHR